jgi:valyl-tRNA synthetase
MWEKGGYFKPSNDPNKPDFDPSRKPFVISIPPPNVTGELHLGHVMFVAMEDLMIRYQRMKGVPTLWVPGTDHAGIATQLQVEKDLLRTEEVTREELGREKFLERAWAWKVKYHDIITSQIRRIGASCDWERERFTLDEGLSKAVREAFVRLYEKGLIYRGPRLINWSPGLFKDRVYPGGHHPAGDDPGRYRRGCPPRRRALPEIHRPESDRADAGTGNPGHCG